CRGLSPATQDALSQVKDRVQSALFQYIRERCEQSLDKASSRFAKILLLLPSIAKVSVLYSENVAFAKMLGTGSLDVELARRLEHEKTPDIWREMIDTSVGALSTGISSTKPQTCTMCKSSEVFEDVHELEAHITADHFGCTPYECEKCSTKKFATEHLVREHYEKDHRLREYYIRYRVSPDIESRREQAREVLKMSTSSLETVKSKEDATLTSGPVATNDVNGTDGHLSGSATRSGVAANVNAGAVLLLQERDVYHTAGEQASEHQR
ncbi:nuclear receptor NHR-88, partial [Aphelenchoides avenae]